MPMVLPKVHNGYQANVELHARRRNPSFLVQLGQRWKQKVPRDVRLDSSLVRANRDHNDTAQGVVAENIRPNRLSLDRLPHDVILEVMQHLEVRDVLSTARVRVLC